MVGNLDRPWSRLGSPRWTPRLIAGVALSSLVVHVAIVVAADGLRGLGTPSTLPGVVMNGLFVLAIVLGARRVANGWVDRDRFPRLLGWYLGGALAFGAINLALIAFFSTYGLVQNAGWLLFAGTMGAGAGFVVGVTEARAIDRAAVAERAATEKEYRAAQADQFAYLNTLLRHEVLNNVQVIRGQATQLLARDPAPDVADRLSLIQRRSEDMADVVEDIRVVNRGLENAELMAVDLGAVLRAELADVGDSYEDVETDLTMSGDGIVVAGRLLARVFANLFSNAVEHNDAAVARVSVTVETTAETTTVRVADNGPGVPPAVRETLFDNSQGPHGVGLYLVDTLLTHYGGDVELTETGPEGTVFTVELQRATATDTDDLVGEPDESSPIASVGGG